VDAAIESRSGEDWLRHGSFLYRPRSGLALLAAGPSTVTIGSDGFTEWRALPASGSLTITGASAWVLYDAQLAVLASGTGAGAPTFSGSDTKYLALLGAAGASIDLQLVTP
jgi:hypothetical protein